MTNQDESTLLAGLRALKETTAAEGAPERVRSAVIEEFRASRANSRRRKAVWWWVGGAVAASVTIAALATMRHAPVPPTTPVAKVEVGPRVLPPVKKQVGDAVAPALSGHTKTAAAPKTARRQKRAPKSQLPVAAEVATDFMPVVAAPPLARGEHASVMRVELPRSSMRAFGFPVVEERRFDRVSADVVIGQDGLIRAVRFVR